MAEPHPPDRVRLDKWLWAARLYKTRSLAADEVDKGRVTVNGLAAKPARELRPGDRLEVRQGAVLRVLRVLALSLVRGPAPVAQALYEETPESLAAREAAAAQRRLGVEPADSQEHGRPTKRDRRRLADWQRWSASLDDVGAAGDAGDVAGKPRKKPS
ncbi:MAG: RNA-binding S4 domain-containing protein [Proteobacteria bacterium]|nr:RNA-binding S4 domain-containing protein [Pseudomonadota bacterium]